MRKLIFFYTLTAVEVAEAPRGTPRFRSIFMHFPYSAPPMHSHNVLVSTGSYSSLIRADVATLCNTPHAHHGRRTSPRPKHITICLTLLLCLSGKLIFGGWCAFWVCISFRNQVLVIEQASDFEKREKNAHHPPKMQSRCLPSVIFSCETVHGNL